MDVANEKNPFITGKHLNICRKLLCSGQIIISRTPTKLTLSCVRCYCMTYMVTSVSMYIYNFYQAANKSGVSLIFFFFKSSFKIWFPVKQITYNQFNFVLLSVYVVNMTTIFTE